MKTKIIVAAFAIASFVPTANAQWNWTGIANASDLYHSYNPAKIGMGLTNPSYKLHIQTSTTNDGILLDQTGSGDATLFLQQGSANYWSLNHTNSGDFSIVNSASGNTPILIEGATDNVVIGAAVTPGARLEVNETTGLATAVAISAIGDAGSANNYGVFGQTGAAGGTGNNVGVYGLLGGNQGAMNSGIYGDANGTSSSGGTFQNWAGYFLGDVGSSTGLYLTSDRKLKGDIKPLQNVLDKLMLLKPSSYNYRFNDFQTMGLPQSKQMGLIAQDLEEVFPNLIKEVKEHKLPAQEGQDERVVPAHKMVNYIGLIPVLIAAVQEQQQQIRDLKSQLAASEQKHSAQTGIEQIISDNAHGFYMEQNIPNPYSEETTINYSLPQGTNNAYMAVYDLSGKQLATYLINKNESLLSLKANDLGAGIYLYSIIADGSVMGTKRMVVSGK